MSSFLNFPKPRSYPKYKVTPTYIKHREVTMGLLEVSPSLKNMYNQSTFHGNVAPNRGQGQCKIDYSRGCPSELQVPDHLSHSSQRKPVKVPILGTQGEICGYHTVYIPTNV